MGFSGCDNRPTCTLLGSCCKNSSCKRSPWQLPYSRCRRPKYCDGFPSPNSSPFKNCCIFPRLDIRSVRETLRTSNEFVVGGERIMARTSVAAIGDKAATTSKHLVLWAVICFRETWASTCANESSGSEDQIFTVIAFAATAAFEAKMW